MPRDLERFWRTTQNLRRFDYGPRPNAVTEVAEVGYITENQPITLSGDATGTGTTAITVELSDTGVTPGAYTNTSLTVDIDGRITAAASGASAAGITQLTGDVAAGPGSGSQAATIAAGVVTYAKQQNVAAARLIGNPSGSVAAHSEISLGTNLSFAGTVLNATGGAGGLSGMTTGQIPIAATATTVTSSANLSGDVTSNATLVATLATVNSTVGTFQGLTVNGKGLVTAAANQSYLTANQTITLSGDLTGSGTVSINAQIAANAVGTTEIANSAVTYAKVQNVANNRVLGNTSGSAAAPSEIVLPLGIANGGTGASTAATAPWVEVAGDQMTGNLGIGVAATTGRLQVAGADTSVIALVTGVTRAVRIGADATSAMVEGVDSTGTTSFQPLSVGGSYVRFTTSNVERVRIDTAGKVGINTTAPNTPLEIKTNNQAQLRLDRDSATTRKQFIEFASQTALNYQMGNDVNDNATQSFFLYDVRASAIRILVDSAGACFNTSGTWAAVSDAAIKTDVEPYGRGLDAILALNPVSYRYNEASPFAGTDDPVRYGLIAQEVAPHVPEAVGSYFYVPEAVGRSGEPVELATLDPGSLIYVLINAVKELSAKVAALKGAG